MKKGVSLITLIVTIIVIIILAGIAVFSSLDTIEQSQEVKSEAEFEDVCTFVRSISTRVEAGLFSINSLSSATPDTVEEISLFRAEDDAEVAKALNDIQGFNNSGRPARFMYYYVTGKQIENDNIPGLENLTNTEESFLVTNKVENNYLINFYYGTVIAKVSQTKTRISGQVK